VAVYVWSSRRFMQQGQAETLLLVLGAAEEA
jgi:hypothetical protein